MWRPPIPIPDTLEHPYRLLQAGLWTSLLVGGSILILAFLFPDFTYSFDFRNPKSSRNTLLEPRVSDGTPRPNGKIAPDETLTVTAGLLGDYSDAIVIARLENKSEMTESLRATLRRSYRAFRFPVGPPVDAFPREELFRVDENYYALREGTLFPFVSEKAYRSRYLTEFAVERSAEWLGQYPIAETFVGFRVGSLLSFADGVFIVTGDTEVRPVGSAEIFLALGYRFEDVVPVSEEDLGIYKRSRIIQLGFTHPDGTLFLDRDSDTISVVDRGLKRPVTDDTYRHFLTERQAPITVSQSAAEVSTSCTLAPGLFARTLKCRAPIDRLANLSGSDLELVLDLPERAIDVNNLTLRLETRKNTTNALRLLAQMKQRILNRFGQGSP